MLIPGDGHALCDKTRLSLPWDKVGGKGRACATAQVKITFAIEQVKYKRVGFHRCTKEQVLHRTMINTKMWHICAGSSKMVGFKDYLF